MRTGNLLIAALGLFSVAFAGYVTWRWGRLPIAATPAPQPGPSGDATTDPRGPRWHAVDAIRSLTAVLAAGAVAGFLVGGGIGRFMMRVLGATSGGDAQGRFTEADEVVGAITLSGTTGFMVFVGLGAGLIIAVMYLVLRPWLPDRAAIAGVVPAVIALGWLGPSDALDADNTDFVLLAPTWAAVTFVVLAAVLTGLTFGSLATRFDRLARSDSRWRFALGSSWLLLLIPPIGASAALYVLGRAVAHGGLRRALAQRRIQVAGRALITLALVGMGLQAAIAGARIIAI